MRRSHRIVFLGALLGATAAVPASAQTRSPGSPPSPPAASPADAGQGSTTTYPSCEGRKPTQADTDAAHGAYVAGKGSFDEADYTTALNYFKDAYRRDCTKHELLVIIARAYELKGERSEAIRALETYLERVPNAQDAEVQKRRIANLRTQIAAMPPAATAPPSSGTGSASAAMPPASPSPSAPSQAPAASGVSASTETAPVSQGPSRTHGVAPWIVVWAGGVALAAGAALLAVGLSDVSDAEKVCPNHNACDNADARSKGNSGRSLETIGVIVGGVGVAAVAAGLVWHFVEPTDAVRPASASSKARVSPDVRPGYAGLSLVGSF